MSGEAALPDVVQVTWHLTAATCCAYRQTWIVARPENLHDEGCDRGGIA
jgi:hypothetical protein